MQRLLKYIYYTTTWLKERFTKEHLTTLWKCWIAQPYDFGYSLDIELSRLDEMIHYFSGEAYCDSHKQTRVLETLNTCRRLLYMIIDNCDEQIRFDASGELHFIGPRVNMRNISRFFSGKNMKTLTEEYRGGLYSDHPDMLKLELYLRKVNSLYYKMRAYYTGMWWD